MSDVVTISAEGSILVATINNPPVNALGIEVRRGLIVAIEQAESRNNIRAILITSTGRIFSGGADIREFATGAKSPTMPEMCERIELSSKPVIIAIQGDALGAALEMSLSAHYRLALPEGRLGFPEVNLGLLPGAGGTQRTPRLAGVKATMDMILTSRNVGASEAHAFGLIDQIVESNDARRAGLSFALELVEKGAKPRQTRALEWAADDLVAGRTAIEAARAEVQKKYPNSLARRLVVDCVAAALDLPFEEGISFERKMFLQCRESDEHKGLVHAFMAERAASDTQELQDFSPRKVAVIGIIGGGTMGSGIAATALDAGFSVTMIETDAAACDSAQKRVEAIYAAQVQKGRLDATARDQTLLRLRIETDLDSLKNADFIIEAVFEDLETKQSVFRQLDPICKRNAILATNTSYLSVDDIAGDTSRSADVIGMHFFSPPNVQKLVEIVVSDKTAPEVVSTAFALAKKLRKTPVRSSIGYGFIGNRIMNAYRLASDYMMEDGATPYQIDKAMRAFGFPMGPYQVADIAGGDIGWANRKSRASTRDPNLRYVEIPDRLCERGWLGQKVGRGFYRYDHGTREGVVDPEVLAIIEAERKRAGIVPRNFTDGEIIRRFMAAMINEAANVVADGVARRPLDVDVVFLAGYGFPRWRGGPMRYADSIGLANILADISKFAQEDAIFWTPSPLLIEIVDRSGHFADLNRPGGNRPTAHA